MRKKLFLYLLCITVVVASGAAFLIFCSKTRLIDVVPATVIRGKGGGLGRPEGIAFSPSGDCIAVSNALLNTITFYRSRDFQNSLYETTPFFTLQNPESQLDYPHDVSFSPDGNHFAVANRWGNSITIYKKSAIHSCYDATPIAVIKGVASEGSSAVKYAPQGNIIAAGNLGNFITFYHYQGDEYDASPYQVIHNAIDILNGVDGLAFSSDGELLAVTSHWTNSVVMYQCIPDSQGLYSSDPVEILQGEETQLHFPHSLNFHPANDYLVVANASGKKTLNLFKKVSSVFPRYSPEPEVTLEIYNPKNFYLQAKSPEEGGVKGVVFSSDGKQMGLCASDIKHSI